jgi:hypothetical protein
MEEVNFQTLYDLQDYETLVKRTAALKDLNMIRYHIIGLLGMGANQMVLKIMILKMPILQKALTVFLKIHYEILKTHRTFPEHAILLERYQNLPYLNQEVEDWISQIKILYQKPPHIQVKETTQLFIEAFEKKDFEMLIDLIPQLKPIHLWSLKLTIKSLLTNPIPQRIKGMLVIALIDARYDEVISVSKGEKILNFNPIDTVNPFKDGTFERYQSELDGMIKDPSVRQIAYSILSTYMLTMVPFEIDPEYYFFRALSNIAYGYLKLKAPNSDEESSEIALIEKKRKHIEMMIKM